MSTSVSTRTAGTLNPTRQQLDELDALLKRMLELPVNQLDDTDDAEADEVADEPAAPPLPSIPSYRGEVRGEGMEPKAAAPPVSYMVVETASPRPLPAASGFETQPSILTPRLVPVTPTPDHSSEEEEPPTPASPPAQMPVEDSPLTATETEAEVWVPLRSTWQPSAQTWQPLAESWQQANGTTPTPAPIPSPMPNPQRAVTPPAPDPIESIRRLAPMVGQAPRLSQDTTSETPLPTTPAPVVVAPVVAAPVVAAPVEPRLSLSAEDAPVSAPLLLMPLVWFNQGFDACLAPLGDPGRWLSGPKGRQIMGVVGMLCLAAAMAIVVSAGMGWTW